MLFLDNFGQGQTCFNCASKFVFDHSGNSIKQYRIYSVCFSYTNAQNLKRIVPPFVHRLRALCVPIFFCLVNVFVVCSVAIMTSNVVYDH